MTQTIVAHVGNGDGERNAVVAQSSASHACAEVPTGTTPTSDATLGRAPMGIAAQRSSQSIVTCPECDSSTHPEQGYVGGRGYVTWHVCDAMPIHTALEVRVFTPYTTQYNRHTQQLDVCVDGVRIGQAATQGGAAEVYARWAQRERFARFVEHDDPTFADQETSMPISHMCWPCEDARVASGDVFAVCAYHQRPDALIYAAPVRTARIYEVVAPAQRPHYCLVCGWSFGLCTCEAGAAAVSESGPPSNDDERPLTADEMDRAFICAHGKRGNEYCMVCNYEYNQTHPRPAPAPTTPRSCATMGCDTPATTEVHGYAFCQPCGEDARQAAEPLPAVDAIDTGAILASVKRQQKVMAGERVLWKRRIGRGAGSRVHDVPATVLEWNKKRAVLRTDANYVASVLHGDIALLANWSSDTQEAA